MRIPDHLTCLLRNLYAGQEATVRTLHGTTDWFKTGKRVRQGCILSPCLFNLYVENITRNASLDELQAGIKTAGRNSNNLRYADDGILKAESKEEPNKPLDEGENGEWKRVKTQHSKNWDHGIQFHHFTANRSGKHGNSDRFSLLAWAPKSLWMMTAAMKLGDTCFLEEKQWQNLDSPLKSKNITLLTKVQRAKAMVFPVVMYGHESWP